MNNTYSKAYTEVLEIINHFSEEEYKKIPKEKIDFFEENKDKDYNFKIDPNVNLAEQNISQNANAILVSLFRDCFATDKQKEVLRNLLQQNQEKIEIEKYEKYNLKEEFIKAKEDMLKNELIKELCPRMEEQFLFFKRVNYQNLGRIREDDLLEKLKKENNALCIVNTKKAAGTV